MPAHSAGTSVIQAIGRSPAARDTYMQRKPRAKTRVAAATGGRCSTGSRRQKSNMKRVDVPIQALTRSRVAHASACSVTVCSMLSPGNPAISTATIALVTHAAKRATSCIGVCGAHESCSRLAR